MGKIAFFVELEIDPSRREAFAEMMLQHSEATLTGENGCLAFDVYAHRANPNRYALYELYADEAALDVHRFSERLAKHRKETDPLILKRRIWTVGDEIDVSNFPGEEG